MTEREIAAEMLQSAICAAICSNDLTAREWLFLHRKPTTHEIRYPAANGFILTCRKLKIRWPKLYKSLILAEKLPKPHLRLVPKSE